MMKVSLNKLLLNVSASGGNYHVMRGSIFVYGSSGGGGLSPGSKTTAN